MTAPEVSTPAAYSAKDYKSDLKPIWCAGCGDFGVLNAFYRAFAALNLEPHRIAFFSGIGCSSRIPGYANTYGFNSVHGRAVPMAMGAKLAHPELTVVVAAGDGDIFSIGGGHLPHAVRRNVDLTVVVMDNQIYGLTKGQHSPTTPLGDITSTTPYGSTVRPINPLQLVLSYGCGFIAQGGAHDIKHVADLIRQGIEHKGFAFINVRSPCVTYRGGAEQFQRLRDMAINLDETGHDFTDKLRAMAICENYHNELRMGVIYHAPDTPEYSFLQQRQRHRAKKRGVYDRRNVLDRFKVQE